MSTVHKIRPETSLLDYTITWRDHCCFRHWLRRDLAVISVQSSWAAHWLHPAVDRQGCNYYAIQFFRMVTVYIPRPRHMWETEYRVTLQVASYPGFRAGWERPGYVATLQVTPNYIKPLCQWILKIHHQVCVRQHIKYIIANISCNRKTSIQSPHICFQSMHSATPHTQDFTIFTTPSFLVVGELPSIPEIINRLQ